MSTSMQDTSIEAYESIKHKLCQAQLRVLDILYENPDTRDWTNMELANFLGWSINRVTPRVFELRELGVLIESRRRFCNITKRRSIAWRVKQ